MGDRAREAEVRAEKAEADKARLEARAARWKRAAKNERREYETLAKSNDEFSRRFDELRNDLGLPSQEALSGDGSRVLAVVEAAQPIFEDIREIVGGWQGNPAYERHPPELGVTLKTNAGVMYAISDTLDRLDKGEGDADNS